MTKFQSLKIERARWGDNKGKLEGVLDIGGKKGNLSLKLPDELAEQILQLAKNAIIDGVEQTANDFIFEITTAIPETPLLGHNAEVCHGANNE
jgi:hypothetical protein